MSKMKNILLFAALLAGAAPMVARGASIKQGERAGIYLAAGEKPVVQTALALLQRDMQAVLGATLHAVDRPSEAKIIAGTLGHALVPGLDTSAIAGRWEAFLIAERRGQIIVAGSDARGTAYGLLELSRLLGVSPWEWWSDVAPNRRALLTLPDGYRNVQQPTVRYRGIFINDEDWGLMPWATRRDSATCAALPKVGRTKGAVTPAGYAKVFELMLRLRANTLWPAMHECTVPFYLVPGNKEMADRYGIVVGTSHCEPMMRNSATEWDYEHPAQRYSYLTNRDTVLAYWSERLQALQGSENIITIGMRGKHDGRMEGVRNTREYKDALTRVLADEANLLRKYVNPDVRKIPQQFVPYKEVLDVYNLGLQVPDYVTLVWCDDNHGYIRRLSDSAEQQRAGGAGVYYHISYWGAPHDYLWLASTPPALLRTEMARAYEHGARKLWMLNVGDIKPGEYLTELFMDMAWSIDSVEKQPVFAHLERWAAGIFGSAGAADIAGIMREYYRLAALRKPEHTAWTRVYDKPQWATFSATEYNPHFNRELQRRLSDYAALESRVAKAKAAVPANRRSAFFELVEYPVRGASLINQKWLCAQLGDTVRSLAAYTEIQRLTDEYNHLEGGKWSGMMSSKPRSLAVFARPDFSRRDTTAARPAMPAHEELVVAKNAADAESVAGGKIVEGLGHSFSAVQLQQGGEIGFLFTLPAADSGIIRLGFLPNHDVDQQGMKVEVRVNGRTLPAVDYRTRENSEAWKRNVLRGQAVVEIPYNFKAHRQAHTLITIKALTPYIILDQVMVDMRGVGMNFYEFPVKVN